LAPPPIIPVLQFFRHRAAWRGGCDERLMGYGTVAVSRKGVDRPIKSGDDGKVESPWARLKKVYASFFKKKRLLSHHKKTGRRSAPFP
jgi:hypothetical protein